MDIALLLLGFILLLIGLIGSVLPVLPGPTIAWTGILLLHFSRFGEFSTGFLIISAVLAVGIALLDYFVPIWGTKKFGGSKAGVIGSMLGLVAGLFIPPFGILIGPFVGAVIGELTQKNDFQKALKAGFGSFLGFLAGTAIKLIYCLVIVILFIQEAWVNVPPLSEWF